MHRIKSKFRVEYEIREMDSKCSLIKLQNHDKKFASHFPRMIEYDSEFAENVKGCKLNYFLDHILYVPETFCRIFWCLLTKTAIPASHACQCLICKNIAPQLIELSVQYISFWNLT